MGIKHQHQTMSAHRRMKPAQTEGGVAGCFSWGGDNNAGGNDSAPPTNRSTSSAASVDPSMLRERIDAAKIQCSILHEKGEMEELDHLVGLIRSMEAKLEALESQPQNKTQKGNASSDIPRPSTGQRQAAFFEARDARDKIKQRNRGGSNPLAWN